jgi:hypothetical protein
VNNSPFLNNAIDGDDGEKETFVVLLHQQLLYQLLQKQ